MAVGGRILAPGRRRQVLDGDLPRLLRRQNAVLAEHQAARSPVSVAILDEVGLEARGLYPKPNPLSSESQAKTSRPDAAWVASTTRFVSLATVLTPFQLRSGAAALLTSASAPGKHGGSRRRENRSEAERVPGGEKVNSSKWLS